MKTKLIQASYALIVPIAFIGVLTLLQNLPLNALSKYGSGGILLTTIALVLTFVAVKKEKISFKSIGFNIDKTTPLRFLYGFGVGLVLVTLMFYIVVSFSSLELSINKSIDMYSVLFGLLAIVLLAYMEEIIFRGYAFFKVKNYLGIWPAQILLALLFAWYHDLTGTTFFSQLLGPGVWALIFGFVTLRSKGIALATGLHAALNVGQALVGLKENRDSLWSLEYALSITSEQKTQTEIIGITLQVCLLIIGIILTENYRRKRLKVSKNTKK